MHIKPKNQDKIKILSFQPFSLYTNGGGGRVLRRLYEGHESEVTSLGLSLDSTVHRTGAIKEFMIPILPVTQKWMKWRLRNIAIYLREHTFRTINIKRISQSVALIDFDVLHIVDHGSYASALQDDASVARKPLWVSFHDHVSTTGNTFESTKRFWNTAQRRLVISPELGFEYQKLFGQKAFEVITDGVSTEEMSVPSIPNSSKITVYFAGLLHIDYLPLFSVLADSLDLLTKDGIEITLILRGTKRVSFLDNRLFTTEYRNYFVSDDEIKDELNLATILYLPIKFSLPDFYLYSLSTKMISYLGGSGSILFHGPKDSAAFKLLRNSNAAACCTSTNSQDLTVAIISLLNNAREISNNAKKIAYSQFNLEKIKRKFWHDSNENTQ